MHNWNQLPKQTGKPDFKNLLTILHRENPKRPLNELWM